MCTYTSIHYMCVYIHTFKLQVHTYTYHQSLRTSALLGFVRKCVWLKNRSANSLLTKGGSFLVLIGLCDVASKLNKCRHW